MSTTDTHDQRPPIAEFRAAGMGIRFLYEAPFFRPTRIAPASFVAKDPRGARAFVIGLSDGQDNITVIRYQPLGSPVRRRNVSPLLPSLVANLARYGRHVGTPRIVSEGGLPAVSFPAARNHGDASGTTVRVTFVFSGRDEYRFDCQWSPRHRTTMMDACADALLTIRTT